MAKNIVYNLAPIDYLKSDFREIEERLFKKLALMFDSIYFEQKDTNNVLGIQTLENKLPPILSYLHDAKLIEYLIDVKIVKTHNKKFSPHSLKVDEKNSERAAVNEEISKLIPDELLKMKDQIANRPFKDILLKLKEFGILQPGGVESFHDLTTRRECIDLNETSPDEFYPLLRGQHSFQQNSKETNVIQMILKNIPEPHPDTAWEQIIDFRKDETVRNKYLALINWVNKASSSSSNIKYLYDEYEYLHSEYLKHLKLHKFKTNNSVIEMILTAGVDLVIGLGSGNYFSSMKSLVQISKTRHELLKEEDHPGKELAYIHEVNKTFGNK